MLFCMFVVIKALLLTSKKSTEFYTASSFLIFFQKEQYIVFTLLQPKNQFIATVLQMSLYPHISIFPEISLKFFIVSDVVEE